MMNEGIKDKWVEALLSGKYEQGQHELRTRDDKYCCLGVLCDIMKDEVGGEWVKDEDGDWMFSIPSVDDDNRAVLPATVASRVGFWTDNGSYKDGEESLSADNDRGATFEQIAETIKTRFKEF